FDVIEGGRERSVHPRVGYPPRLCENATCLIESETKSRSWDAPICRRSDRRQVALLPDCLDDYVTEDNPVRVVDAFINELDLAALGFAGVVPEAPGRPSYHPVTLLKIY